MPEIHTYSDYLVMNESKFFYQIVYDQNQKFLSVDRVQIRVGAKFQVSVPTRKSPNTLCNESLVWSEAACSAVLSDTELSDYLNKTGLLNLNHAKKAAKPYSIKNMTLTRDNFMVQFTRFL